MLSLDGARLPDSVKGTLLDLGCSDPHRIQRAGHIAVQVCQENQKDLLDKAKGQFKDGDAEEMLELFLTGALDDLIVEFQDAGERDG